MKIRRLAVILAAVITVLVALFVIFSGPRDSAPISKAVAVRLNAPFPAVDFAPFYVAKTKHWLEEELANTNGKPDYVGSFGEIALSNESLATDRIDLLLTSEIPPIIGLSAGINIKIVWLSCTLFSEVVGQADSPATSLADLKGKKIATLSGSSSHFWLLKNLEKKGLGSGDAQILLYSKPDDAMTAFENKNVDAVALFPPFPEQSIIKGHARVLAGPPAPIQVVMVGRGAFIQEHRAQVDAAIRALNRAKAWIVANPSEAKAIVSKETGISLDVVYLAWPKLDWDAKLNEAVVADIQARADFLKSEGKIKRSINVQKELIMPGIIEPNPIPVLRSDEAPACDTNISHTALNPC